MSLSGIDNSSDTTTPNRSAMIPSQLVESRSRQFGTLDRFRSTPEIFGTSSTSVAMIVVAVGTVEAPIPATMKNTVWLHLQSVSMSVRPRPQGFRRRALRCARHRRT